MRITPYYESKGVKNPYYVLSPSVVNGVVRELKKQGEGYKNIKSIWIIFLALKSHKFLLILFKNLFLSKFILLGEKVTIIRFFQRYFSKGPELIAITGKFIKSNIKINFFI